VFLLALALIGLLVLVQMNAFAIATGITSLAVVSVYPLAKRVIWFPQAVLGLAFSWGALMGWAAVFGRIGVPAILLYAGSILWVIGYDTIYAHQDRDDDAIIGVRSTARLFGEQTRPALALLYAGAVGLILVAGILAGGGILFALGAAGFASHLAWQVRALDIGNPAACLYLFRSNREAGLILFAGIVLDALAGSPGAIFNSAR
jgi:4-hydroxybenzoate polyprenyltransferase